MPPITVTGYEQADDGWYVAWHDEANMPPLGDDGEPDWTQPGQPLDGFIHLTEGKLAELADARRIVGAPVDQYERAAEAARQRRRGEPPSDRRPERAPNAGPLPAEIAAWLDGYNGHVQDCCDRYRLGVRANAPQEVLEGARRGEGEVARWRTRAEGREGMEAFVYRTST